MTEREDNIKNKGIDLVRDYDPTQAAEINERLHYRRLALEEKLRRIEEAQFVSQSTMNLVFAPCTHQVIRDEAGHVVDLDNNKHIQ
jgi:hypothetical protein